MDDLKIIKKNYGEKMMHLCRELFPTILENSGVLSKIMLDHFNPSRFLYDDITVNEYKKLEFKNYIYGLYNDDDIKEIDLEMSVSELMNMAGYDIYECNSEEDIQKFRKYYALNEELCTFNGGRLNFCYVFFAVKKNVDEIKRENFLKPCREDEYGTSVISIQFSRGLVNTLSIKNRYNHMVSNPDATFSNNLENIIPGLTKAFEKEYKLNINQSSEKKFSLYNYVLANDGRYYRYNYEIDNIYYCPDNIIIDNFNVIKYEYEKYIVMDYFIVDLKRKLIRRYDSYNNMIYSYDDYFCEYNNSILKIDITSNKEDRTRVLNIDTNKGNIKIVIDKYNRMISYRNDFIEKIDDDFLYRNKFLKEIILPNVVSIGDDFLYFNGNLEKIYAPKLEIVENNFLRKNCCLEEIYLNNLVSVGDNFLLLNERINKVYMPRLEYVGFDFMNYNKELKEIILPNLVKIKNGFLYFNKNISRLYLPKLNLVGNDFLRYNENIEILYLPEVFNIGNTFLFSNEKIKSVYMPNLRKVGYDFLRNNKELIELRLPNLSNVGDEFLKSNKVIKKVYFPKLEKVGYGFLSKNLELTELDLPLVTSIDCYFLGDNLKMERVNMPELDKFPDENLPFASNDKMRNQLIESVRKRKMEEELIINKENNICDNDDIDGGIINGFKRRILSR